jgi:hypothetical protein
MYKFISGIFLCIISCMAKAQPSLIFSGFTTYKGLSRITAHIIKEKNIRKTSLYLS